MAPAKKTQGSKREAPVKAPAAKKAKVDSPFQAVIEAIELATGLPEGCKKMLLAGLLHGLGVPMDERMEIQQQLVDMIGEVVQGVEATLQSDLDEEGTKLASDERHRDALHGAVTRAEETHIAAETVSKEKVRELAAAAEASLAAKGTLRERQEAKRTGDATMAEVRDRKAALEQGVHEHFKVILEGESPTEHYQKLSPLLQCLNLDDSLLSALPNVCLKKLAERGSFDTLVLEQLSQALQEHVAKLTTAVGEAQPEAEERVAAVAAAQGVAEELAAAQLAAVDALAAAKAEQQAAAGAVQAAREALATFEAALAGKAEAKNTCAKKLEDFRASSVVSFKQLSGKVAAAPLTGA